MKKDKEVLVVVKYDCDNETSDMICTYYKDFTFVEEYIDDDEEDVVKGKWRIDEDGIVQYMIIDEEVDVWSQDAFSRDITDAIIEQELLRE